MPKVMLGQIGPWRARIATLGWLLASLGLAMIPCASPARTPAVPEQVALAHAKAWSDGDLPGLLALYADSARIHDRSRDPHKLSGGLSETIGSKDRLATHFRKLIAQPPLARETISEMATVGDLLIAAGTSIPPSGSGANMRFLTAYRIRDRQIHDLWHITWIPDTQSAADPVQVIRQLIEANNARDTDRFLGLFSPDAKNFRYSEDPHALADRPSSKVTDAASREAVYRKYFAGAPVQVEAVKLFSVGDLVVEQSHVTGFPGAPEKTVNQVSIYRIRDGRIVDDWLLGEETLSMQANDAEAVVLKDFDALSRGDVDGLAALFAPDFAMHRRPTEPHMLVGPLSDRMRTREQLRTYFQQAFVAEPPALHEVIEMVSLGDYVIVRVAIHAPDKSPPDHAFTAFRVREGMIDGLWHIALVPDAAPESGAMAKAAVERLGDANNRGDADAFVDLYHPDARHFHSRRDPSQLGGGPSKRVTDHAVRRRLYREMFSRGPPARVDLIDSVALGEWVATRERYTGPDDPPRDHLTIYRVRDGLILDDWHVAP